MPPAVSGAGEHEREPGLALGLEELQREHRVVEVAANGADVVPRAFVAQLAQMRDADRRFGREQTFETLLAVLDSQSPLTLTTFLTDSHDRSPVSHRNIISDAMLLAR